MSASSAKPRKSLLPFLPELPSELALDWLCACGYTKRLARVILAELHDPLPSTGDPSP